ncbi:unnamed protein product, partial [Meganyctiphanes norvegica]
MFCPMNLGNGDAFSTAMSFTILPKRLGRFPFYQPKSMHQGLHHHSGSFQCTVYLHQLHIQFLGHCVLGMTVFPQGLHDSDLSNIELLFLGHSIQEGRKQSLNICCKLSLYLDASLHLFFIEPLIYNMLVT